MRMPLRIVFRADRTTGQNANRAAGLVRQLLAFSRRQTLRPQVLALADLLSDLSILLQRLLGERRRPEEAELLQRPPQRFEVQPRKALVLELEAGDHDAGRVSTGDLAESAE